MYNTNYKISTIYCTFKTPLIFYRSVFVLFFSTNHFFSFLHGINLHCVRCPLCGGRICDLLLALFFSLKVNCECFKLHTFALRVCSSILADKIKRKSWINAKLIKYAPRLLFASVCVYVCVINVLWWVELNYIKCVKFCCFFLFS